MWVQKDEVLHYVTDSSDCYFYGLHFILSKDFFYFKDLRT